MMFKPHPIIEFIFVSMNERNCDTSVHMIASRIALFMLQILVFLKLLTNNNYQSMKSCFVGAMQFVRPRIP